MTMNNTPQSLYSRTAWTMGCYQDLKIFYDFTNVFMLLTLNNLKLNIYKVVVGIQTLDNTILNLHLTASL